jgi:DNA adenine methylase
MEFGHRKMKRDWAWVAENSSPLFRWVGGKRAFVKKNSQLFPKVFNCYYEPFAGGLSVFFHLTKTSEQPVKATIGDLNHSLISTYQAVQADWKQVAHELEYLVSLFPAPQKELLRLAFSSKTRSLTNRQNENFNKLNSLLRERQARVYNQIRDEYNLQASNRTAASFIFLMSTCYNGLYRVNASGSFNTPLGFVGLNLKVPSAENLQAASLAFSEVSFIAQDWSETLRTAGRGDFVFVDPPYFSDTLRVAHTKYSSVANRFTREHHQELARRLVVLAADGADFVLTNSGEVAMIDMYQAMGLSVECGFMKGSFNSKVSSRSKLPELIVRPGGELSQ